jgi:26S proteasome regulatory subunit N6
LPNLRISNPLIPDVQNVEIDDTAYNEDSIRNREQGILELGAELTNTGEANEVGKLIKETRPFFNQISKAEAFKLVRSCVDMFLDNETSTGFEVQHCQVRNTE